VTNTSVQRTTSDERELMLGANERAWGFTDSESIDLHCECGRVACPDTTHVTRRTYERVRSVRAEFIVVPGHERLGTERVTEAGDGYAVVKNMVEGATVSMR
jgi:hypothetical protein